MGTLEQTVIRKMSTTTSQPGLRLWFCSVPRGKCPSST